MNLIPKHPHIIEPNACILKIIVVIIDPLIEDLSMNKYLMNNSGICSTSKLSD